MRPWTNNNAPQRRVRIVNRRLAAIHPRHPTRRVRLAHHQHPAAFHVDDSGCRTHTALETADRVALALLQGRGRGVAERLLLKIERRVLQIPPSLLHIPDLNALVDHPHTGKNVRVLVHRQTVGVTKDLLLAFHRRLSRDFVIDSQQLLSAWRTHLQLEKCIRHTRRITTQRIDLVPITEIEGNVILVHVNPHGWGLDPEVCGELFGGREVLQVDVSVLLFPIRQRIEGHVADLDHIQPDEQRQ